MTSTVAVAVACLAVVLALIPIVSILRLNQAVLAMAQQLADLKRQPAASDPIAIVDVDTGSAEQSVPLSAANAAQRDVTSAPDVVEAHDRHTGAPEPSLGADADVRVITNMAPARDGADDLTTARIASVTLGGPLIKVAAFSHGVRRALNEEQRMRISYAVRKELRRQRKLRRRGRSHQAPSKRWQP